MRWISVRRMKPEKFRRVLGYCGGDEVQMVVYDGISNFVGIDGCIVEYVSHWMEIELPPSETEDPCACCRWQLSWDEAEARAARVSEATRGEYTAEDAMCDNDMEHCNPCPRWDHDKVRRWRDE